MMKKNKPVNMATGGLMSMPPFIKKSEDEKDKGITPYDVNTPKEARQGLPSRLVAPSRTRFESGDSTDLSKNPNYKGWKKIYEKNPDVAEMNDNHSAYLAFYNSENKDKKAYGGLMRKKYNTGGGLDLDDSGDTTMKDVLIGRGVIDADGNMISKNKKAYGGLMKRQKFAAGDRPISPVDLPDEDDMNPDDGYPLPGSDKMAGGNSARDKLINEKINQLEARAMLVDDISEKSKIENEITKLEGMKSTNIKTAATGGLMKMSIGGEAGTSERYDRRRDYQAYAEGDMVEDESLMTPTGMNTEDMDGIAEANMEMEAEDNMDMGDMDGVVDTSALSEEEEKVVDDAVEMFPELEAIIPKIVATEFTEDGEVEGPGTGTSDSIPALLSDGEFVFTAKAVKNIGVDKLRKMMKDAEAAYDAGMQNQEADAAMAE
jgi:hypothetical protein